MTEQPMKHPRLCNCVDCMPASIEKQFEGLRTIDKPSNSPSAAKDNSTPIIELKTEKLLAKSLNSQTQML